MTGQARSTSVFEVGDIITANARGKLGEAIDIIAYHGSQVKGTATDRSDLDLHYVPNTSTSAHFTVLFEDKCFDLHPVSWEREKARAEYDDPLTSTVAFSRVVYSRSPDTLKRYNDLKARIVELQKPQHKRLMTNKAMRILTNAAWHKHLLDGVADSDVVSARMTAVQLMEVLLHSLAVMNQTFFKDGLGKNRKEIADLRKKPGNTAEVLSVVMESGDVAKIKGVCSEFMYAVRELLIAQQQEAKNDLTISSVFACYYPEAREQLVKILVACEKRDTALAICACKQIQSEVARFLACATEQVDYSDFNIYSEYSSGYVSLGLPDIISCAAESNFDVLRDRVAELDTKLRKILADNSVGLNIVESKDHLAANHWHRV
jgi:hypothetical protein